LQYDLAIVSEKQSEGLFLLLENAGAMEPIHGIPVDMQWLKGMRMQL
jgi:hypothetical protein